MLCVLFTLMIVPAQYKNPISQIMSYPPAIRKRVETLPEFKDTIKQQEKKQVIKKVIACFLASVLFAGISYFSGAKTFGAAFTHTFILFFVVNIYDLIVLDIILFCNSKRVIIKGTEDMRAEYRNPIHHIKGAAKGLCLGLIVGLATGSIVTLINIVWR